MFLACLVAAIFLAAAAPEETRARAVFSFSFAWKRDGAFMGFVGGGGGCGSFS